MTRSWRSSVLLVLSAIVVALAAFLVARWWLAPDPQVPSFSRPHPPRFEPLPARASLDASGPRRLGRVLDEAGTPVEGAIVYARVDGVPLWTLSSRDGGFELLLPRSAASTQAQSEIELVVTAWGVPPRTYSAAMQGESLEIVLPPRFQAPTALPKVELAALEGRIVPALARPAGEPAAYDLVLLPEAPPLAFSAAVARRVRCADDGSFAIPDLALGAYRLMVLPAWAEGGSWPDLLAAGHVRYEHPPEDAAPLVLPLSEGAVHGVLLDSDGEPVQGGLLLLSEAAAPGHLWPAVTSNESGAFRWGDLPEGVYRLTVRAGEARIEEVEVSVAAGKDEFVELPPLALRAND